MAGEGVMVVRVGGVGGGLWGLRDSGRRWLEISETMNETSDLRRERVSECVRERGGKRGREGGRERGKA